MGHPSASQADLVAMLAHARRLAASGADEAAKSACIAALRIDPTSAEALVAIARLASRSGHRSAARIALAHCVACHPTDTTARLGLGHLLLESGEHELGREQFAAALAAQPDLEGAHQGLARALTGLGDLDAATPHWRAAFGATAVSPQPFHGANPGIPVLLLVSARGGNIPTRTLLDDTVFAVTALYAEFHQPGALLPPHALLFNAIGDADLCGEALTKAAAVARQSSAPIVNHPDSVAATGRADNAERLSGLNDVVAPMVRSTSRTELLADAGVLRFPLLVRAPGYHTGQHFVRVARRADLATEIASLPGDQLLAIDPMDARGADGLSRKFRVMFIEGQLYPLHLAISHEWKVHYFSGAMAEDPAHRAEEAAFLADMPAVLGPRAMAALAALRDALGLDYAGVDFALAPDGRLLLFEANAGMVIQPPGPDPMWDYRRAPIDRALAAVKAMFLKRAAGSIRAAA
jgi:tetratricopeptide (TPR) repeat protein